jgi:hypothetical protein
MEARETSQRLAENPVSAQQEEGVILRTQYGSQRYELPATSVWGQPETIWAMMRH